MDPRESWENTKDNLESILGAVIEGKENIAEGMQQAGQWWQETTLAKNLNEAASSINKAWKNSSIGKTVAAVSANVNKAAVAIGEKWNNSSVGKFCNQAKTSVTDFYEKHKTAINIALGVGVIAICAVATIATGGATVCALAKVGAIASKALIGSAVGGAGGAAMGGLSGAMDYMEEHGTLDGAGNAVLEGASSGFAKGAMTGAVTYGSTQINKKFCFIAGTLVLTTVGFMSIEEVRAGDYVYAQDVETGETDYQPVLQTYINQTEELYTVTIEGEEIQTTPGHPFYTEEEGWVSAKDLEAGDKVTTADGEEATVDKVEKEELDEPVNVYNFNVMDYHTYYVGEGSVLVHNKCETAKNTAEEANKSLNNAVDKSGSSSNKVLGGSFKDVDATRGTDEVGHHMPQNAYNKTIGISRNDGPALLMSKEDHALTRSFAGRGKATMKEDIGLSARQRMAKDLWYIKNKFGTKYNEGIKQMLEYTKTLPEFQK